MQHRRSADRLLLRGLCRLLGSLHVSPPFHSILPRDLQPPSLPAPAPAPRLPLATGRHPGSCLPGSSPGRMWGSSRVRPLPWGAQSYAVSSRNGLHIVFLGLGRFWWESTGFAVYSAHPHFCY